MDFPSVEAVVNRVKELDQNDEAYMAMLREPAFLNPEECSMESVERQITTFMEHIVEQPLDKAQRYNREYWGQRYRDREQNLILRSRKTWKDLVKERFLPKL